MTSKKKYPRIGEIRKKTPQGLCVLCNKVFLRTKNTSGRGKKPDKCIVVEWDYFRGNDDVFKAHSDCIENISKDYLLKTIMDNLGIR